ncbi:MAG: glucosaminidase domain-containing protein [Bacteroidetes bacterium]|nr:glucosaminidase domain-containing protein [Bacteroidota bacterium]
MKIRSFIFYTLLFIPVITFSRGNSTRVTREEYIAQHKEDAVKDMKKTGVPASITLAQALLESEDGNSVLATEANNHFGIKCAEWTGDTYTKDDDKKDECFRKYHSVLESFDDHSNFLRTRDRYASLFKLKITDYKGWAKGLKKAGYATNPEYAARLVKIIEDNQLHLLDEGKNLPASPVASAPVVPEVISTPVPVAATETKNKKPEKKISSSYPNEVDIFEKRKIYDNNGVEYVLAKKGDTFKSLSKELELGLWQLPKYNEMEDGSPISEGQIIYIKPKKSETSKAYYVAKDGDTIHSISQELGIKSKYIYKWNNFSKDQEVQSGQRILLQKQKS